MTAPSTAAAPLSAAGLEDPRHLVSEHVPDDAAANRRDGGDHDDGDEGEAGANRLVGAGDREQAERQRVDEEELVPYGSTPDWK